MFPHPLAVRTVEGGLRVWYPGAATMLPLAAQAGDNASAAECDRRRRAVLESFLTATDANGAPKRGDLRMGRRAQ